MSKKNKTIRVKLIANPDAGNASEGSDNLKLVVEYLKKSGLEVDITLAKPKEKATAVAKRAVKKEYKIVIAMGGDGMVEAVMRGVIGSKVHLGIIPTGLRNNIAKSMGISTNLEEACDLIISDKTSKVDMGRVKTKNGKKYIFFEMATIGISANLFPKISKAALRELSKGKLAAEASIQQKDKPQFFLAINDESKIEIDTLSVLVSNMPVLGNNIKISQEASIQDGMLDVSVFPGFNEVEMRDYYAAVLNGGYSSDRKVQHYQMRKLKVKTAPKLNVIADGVSLGKGPVTIKVLPGALRVITTGKIPGQKKPQKTGAKILTPPVSRPNGKKHLVENVILSK
jgi:YegS/Rv2252/BmrU family lipid kinase